MTSWRELAQYLQRQTQNPALVAAGYALEAAQGAPMPPFNLVALHTYQDVVRALEEKSARLSAMETPSKPSFPPPPKTHLAVLAPQGCPYLQGTRGALHAAGYTTWALDDMLPGVSWDEEIPAQLDKVDGAVVLLSLSSSYHQANNQHYLHAPFDYLRGKVQIVPFLFPGAAIPLGFMRVVKMSVTESDYQTRIPQVMGEVLPKRPKA